MRKILLISICILLCLSLAGCQEPETVQVAATTLPVYEFASILCEGTDITIARLIETEVSCLHDYSLDIRQMQTLENAEVILISGAGLEDFMGDILGNNKNIIDASDGIELLCQEPHDHPEAHSHSHDGDPHIWLAPQNAKVMANNICRGLIAAYPQHETLIKQNLEMLNVKIQALQSYADTELALLSSRNIITFHDGFSYLANAFDLNILHAIEEESGSEASAAELVGLIQIVTDNNVTAIFTENNGSSAAASVIARETNINIFALDMAISGDSYFTAMYQNIDTLKEALK